MDSLEIKIQCFKLLGAGTATIGLIVAGAGVGIVFGSLIQILWFVYFMNIYLYLLETLLKCLVFF